MTDTTFKTAEPIAEKAEIKATNKEVVVAVDATEEPFSIYKDTHKNPYSAKYFGIDNLSESEVFNEDLQSIDSYLLDLVKRGSLKDNKEAVDKKIKAIEKMADIDSLESNAQRMRKLSAFVRYLREIDYAI